MASAKLNVAVIGAGRIGRVHAEHLVSRVRGAGVPVVADVDTAAAQRLADEFGIPEVAGDYRDVIARDDIDAVVVCTSTDTHAQIIVAAASAGKHVFCEKPIDTELERIEAVLGEVDRAGIKFQVGFNRRFDANFLRVKKALSEGKVGRPHVLKITSRDPAPPPIGYVEHSGGMFMDMMIHDFDMARNLVGCEVEEVFAAGAVLVDARIGEAGDIDTAAVTLRFENGAIGVIDNSRQAVYGYDQRVEVFGSEGMVAAGNRRQDEHLIADRQGVHSALPLYFFMERYVESFVTEMQAFVDAVRNDTETPVNGRDGYMPVAIAHAANRSLRENRPVRLDEIIPAHAVFARPPASGPGAT